MEGESSQFTPLGTAAASYDDTELLKDVNTGG
jgi:hypothetical protein